MATRGLRLHSAIGADARHVARSIDIIARLPPPDRIAVVRAVYETAALVSAPTDYPGDDAVDELVARHARRVSIPVPRPS